MAAALENAFGMPISSTGSSANPFGFAGCFGYQEDPDSGLNLLGHRYYDPSTGRFLTRDPVKDGRNWYGHCGNNPLAAVDPEGLESCWAWPQNAVAAVDDLVGKLFGWFGEEVWKARAAAGIAAAAIMASIWYVANSCKGPHSGNEYNNPLVPAARPVEPETPVLDDGSPCDTPWGWNQQRWLDEQVQQ